MFLEFIRLSIDLDTLVVRKEHGDLRVITGGRQIFALNHQNLIPIRPPGKHINIPIIPLQALIKYFRESDI